MNGYMSMQVSFGCPIRSDSATFLRYQLAIISTWLLAKKKEF